MRPISEAKIPSIVEPSWHTDLSKIALAAKSSVDYRVHRSRLVLEFISSHIPSNYRTDFDHHALSFLFTHTQFQRTRKIQNKKKRVHG